jgi:hypothetical protein
VDGVDRPGLDVVGVVGVELAGARPAGARVAARGAVDGVRDVPPLLLPLRLTAIALVLASLWPGRLPRRLLLSVLVTAFVGLMLAPMVDDHFDHDAPALRAAYARYAPFDDWNHPALPYLLNVPARWSSEPVVLRAVPSAWALLEALLLLGLGTRLAGPPAGALAAVWFAAELRRRRGVWDLGDWDLAGVVTLVALGWLLAEARRRRPEGAIEAALLGVLAVSSSILGVAPALAMALALLVAAARDREGLPAVAGAGLAAAWALGRVRATASAAPASAGVRPGRELFLGMVHEWPVGRTAWLLVPMLLGVAWLVRRRREPWAVYALSLVALVPLLVTLGAASSRVHGAYYVGLATPVWALAAGCGTWRALQRLPRPWLRAPLLVGVVVASVVVPDEGYDWPGSGLGEAMVAFAGEVDQDERPILSNDPAARPLVALENDLRRPGALAEALPDSDGPLSRRVVQRDCLGCLADPVCVELAADSWIMMRVTGVSEAERTCALTSFANCRPVGSLPRHPGAVFHDCRPARREALIGPPGDGPIAAPPPQP